MIRFEKAILPEQINIYLTYIYNNSYFILFYLSFVPEKTYFCIIIRLLEVFYGDDLNVLTRISFIIH